MEVDMKIMITFILVLITVLGSCMIGMGWYIIKNQQQLKKIVDCMSKMEGMSGDIKNEILNMRDKGGTA